MGVKVKKYKVTGKFCAVDEAGNVVKEEVFINKIIKEYGPRSAMDSVVAIFAEKFSLKYGKKIELRTVSNVLVKRI